MRLAKKCDAEKYYADNYCPLDKEVVRMTGSKKSFTKDEVVSFFLKAVDEDNIYLFSDKFNKGRLYGAGGLFLML